MTEKHHYFICSTTNEENSLASFKTIIRNFVQPLLAHISVIMFTDGFEVNSP